MRRIELPSGTLDVRVTGPARGPVVVLVHGYLVDHQVWSTLPDLLGAKGFRCYAPTWPLGCQRAAFGRPLTPSGVADLVGEFLEAIDGRDVTLVGNDTGGAIVQLLLCPPDQQVDCQAAPRISRVNRVSRVSRVGRLVLTNCDAFEVFPPRPFDLLFRLARHPALTRLALQPCRSVRVRHWFYGLLSSRELDPGVTADWLRPYLTDPRVRAEVTAFARDWRPDVLVGLPLETFDKPVLLLWAPDDRFFTIDLGRRLEDAFPQARLVEIPQARTFVGWDRPELVAEQIERLHHPDADRLE